MADQKISNLTGATTPLVGTEVLPLVQSSATVKVSIANITAGRDVSATSIATGLGASATPAYTFTDDLNTGMWSPAADTIAFSEGGTEVLRINSSSNVGIGTSAPVVKLDVAGTIQSNALVKVLKNGSDTIGSGPYFLLSNTTNDQLWAAQLGGSGDYNLWGYSAAAGWQRRMLLDAFGNVGINTVSVAGYGSSIQLKQAGGSAAGSFLIQNLSTAIQRLDILNNALPPSGGYTGGYNFTATGAAATMYSTESGTHAWYISNAVGTAGTAVVFNKRMDIDFAGNVSVGVASIATTATDGFLYIPACAGIPTGTPTAKTGLAPMVVDSTNNKLYVYIGGAWRVMN